MRAKLSYQPVYADLSKAIRELGEKWVLYQVNAALHHAGMQKKRAEKKRAQAKGQAA